MIGIESIRELLECLLSKNAKKSQRTEVPAWNPSRKKTGEDFREVNGQFAVRRAAEIAAAGMHNLLMIGSPGAGKTMIARRMPSILPKLTLEESLKISKVYSACGLLAGKEGLMTGAAIPFAASYCLRQCVDGRRQKSKAGRDQSCHRRNSLSG